MAREARNAQGRRGENPSESEDRLKAMMSTFGSDDADESASAATNEEEDTEESATDTGGERKTPTPETQGTSDDVADEDPFATQRAELHTRLEAYEAEVTRLQKDYKNVQSYADRRGNEMADLKRQLDDAVARLNQTVAYAQQLEQYNREWQVEYATLKAQTPAQQASATETPSYEDEGYADPVARKRADELERKLQQQQEAFSKQMGTILGTLQQQQQAQETQQRQQQVENLIQNKIARWRRSVKDPRVLSYAEHLYRTGQFDDAEDAITLQASLEATEVVRRRREAAEDVAPLAEEDAGSGSTRAPRPRSSKRTESEPPDFSKMTQPQVMEWRKQRMMEEVGASKKW